MTSLNELQVAGLGAGAILDESREKTSICVVDDFATICNILKSMLGKIGFNEKNISAIYGPKASSEMNKNLEIYGSYEPELSWKIPKLLFLDWHMPGLTGLDLLKKIRKDNDPRVSNMIVFLVTAEASKERVVEAIQAGVDNYLTKPHTKEMLEKKLNAVSTKIFRKIENLARQSPDEICYAVEMLNLSIALDSNNEDAKKLKQEILGQNLEMVEEVVGIKVKSGKDSADQGKYNKAVGEFGSALDLKPSDPVALMEYGKMMMKKTLYEEAVDSFESALNGLEEKVEARQFIREVDLLDLLGEAQLKLSLTLEDPGEMSANAIKTLEMACKLFEEEKDEKGQAKSLTKIGAVYSARAAEAEKKARTTIDAIEAHKFREEAQDHNKRAISEYEEAIKRDIEQSAALIMLADAYQRAGKQDEAEKAMKKAQELKPEDPLAMIAFGKAFLDKGENNAALSYFNSAKRKISKEDIELYEEIILGLLESNLPEEALPFIETIAEERPDLYNNLGVAYRRAKKLKKAIEAYGKAIKYDITGDRVGYLYNQGIALKMDGDISSAIKNFLLAYKTDRTFEKAAEQLEINCVELCNRAQQNLKANNTTSAKFFYKLAYVANPKSDIAKDGLNQLNIDPATLWDENELKQLGVYESSLLMEDFGA